MSDDWLKKINEPLSPEMEAAFRYADRASNRVRGEVPWGLLLEIFTAGWEAGQKAAKDDSR